MFYFQCCICKKLKTVEDSLIMEVVDNKDVINKGKLLNEVTCCYRKMRELTATQYNSMQAREDFLKSQ
jgi:hypothetical protein